MLRGRRNSRFGGMDDGFFSGMPLGFKLWFGFVALVAVSMFAVMIFVGVNVASMASDPEAMGNYLGQIVKGFEQATE